MEKHSYLGGITSTLPRRVLNLVGEDQRKLDFIMSHANQAFSQPVKKESRFYTALNNVNDALNGISNLFSFVTRRFKYTAAVAVTAGILAFGTALLRAPEIKIKPDNLNKAKIVQQQNQGMNYNKLFTPQEMPFETLKTNSIGDISAR